MIELSGGTNKQYKSIGVGEYYVTAYNQGGETKPTNNYIIKRLITKAMSYHSDGVHLPYYTGFTYDEYTAYVKDNITSQKGNLIDTVTGEDETEYPKDGVKNNYWYTYIGIK